MSLRKELESEIYAFMDDMDPSGKNTERLKRMFTKMNDQQFYRYMDEFFDNPDKNFTVAYEPMNNPVTVQFAQRVADKHHIPLYEYVYKPYLDGNTEDPPKTIHKILVIDLPIKRLKQMVFTKGHTSVTNTKRDARTGQVTGHDKTARVTDVEAYSMIVQELYSCAQEAYGPMADDQAAMYEMLRLIQKDGEVSLSDLPNDTTNKVTMNTIDVFMKGSGLITNMVDESGYLLSNTIRSKENKISTIER